MAGLAWHSSSTPLITLFPLLSFSLSLLLPPCARRTAMGDPKWSCWRSATLNPQVILLATRSSRTTVSSLESLAALHSPDHELQWLAIAWLCFALDCHWNFVGRYFVTAELFHAFDLNWADSERTLRRLRRDRLRFTSAVSHQDQWWSSCACALHLLATRDGSLGCSTYHLLLTTPSLCVTRTYPILSSLLSPAPPRHEYILNGTWRRHRTFPVASRYRYIPNTLGRKRLRWPLPFPACVHPFNSLRV